MHALANPMRMQVWSGLRLSGPMWRLYEALANIQSMLRNAQRWEGGTQHSYRFTS